MPEESKRHKEVKPSERRGVIIGLALTALFVVALFFVILVYGLLEANPRGDTMPPGP